jgi:hypothetical protein
MNQKDKPLCATWTALYPSRNLYFTIPCNMECYSLRIVTASEQLTRARDISKFGAYDVAKSVIKSTLQVVT